MTDMFVATHHIRHKEMFLFVSIVCNFLLLSYLPSLFSSHLLSLHLLNSHCTFDIYDVFNLSYHGPSKHSYLLYHALHPPCNNYNKTTKQVLKGTLFTQTTKHLENTLENTTTTKQHDSQSTYGYQQKFTRYMSENFG